MRQLHELPGRRVGIATHLAVETLEDLLAVSNGAIADDQDILAARHQICDEGLDGADSRFRYLLDSARHLPVHGVEDFALARINDRDNHPVGVAARKRE